MRRQRRRDRHRRIRRALHAPPQGSPAHGLISTCSGGRGWGYSPGRTARMRGPRSCHTPLVILPAMAARPFDKAIRKVAGKQHGAFSARQALNVGGSEHMLQHRLDRGDIERVADGVYVLPGAPRCGRQKLWIALLEAGDGCAIAGRAAPALYGVPGYPERPVDVLAVHGRKNHRLTAGKLRETRALPSHHLRHVDGIAVVSIERALFILAAMETCKRAERATDNALTARLTTPE